MRKPAFKPGSELYYINPFVYIIDKVFIEFVEEEDVNGNIYYIDHMGAYLLEENLFSNLSCAKNQAQEMLDKFYLERTKLIQRANPQLEMDDGS